MPPYPTIDPLPGVFWGYLKKNNTLCLLGPSVPNRVILPQGSNLRFLLQNKNYNFYSTNLKT